MIKDRSVLWYGTETGVIKDRSVLWYGTETGVIKDRSVLWYGTFRVGGLKSFTYFPKYTKLGLDIFKHKPPNRKTFQAYTLGT